MGELSYSRWPHGEITPGPVGLVSQQHRNAQRRIERSRPSVHRVAAYFDVVHRWGTFILPPTLARTAAEAADFSDLGDLYLFRDFMDTLRIEVKQRPALHFTDAASYSYGTVYFTRPKLLARQGTSVHAYYVLNAAKTHAAVVAQSSRAHWREGVAWMSNTGNHEDVVEIGTQHVHFVDLQVEGD
jgi:hypothetical protein